ncbi:hypothetical protein Tco_0070396 [Tanacetum coccineum]
MKTEGEPWRISMKMDSVFYLNYKQLLSFIKLKSSFEILFKCMLDVYDIKNLWDLISTPMLLFHLPDFWRCYTFHVSKLKKCMADEPLAIPLDEIQVDDKLNFIEGPIEIMDREVKRLKQSRILIVKVRWNSKRGPEFTWEREDQMQKKSPHLFTNSAPAAEVAS